MTVQPEPAQAGDGRRRVLAQPFHEAEAARRIAAHATAITPAPRPRLHRCRRQTPGSPARTSPSSNPCPGISRTPSAAATEPAPASSERASGCRLAAASEAATPSAARSSDGVSSSARVGSVNVPVFVEYDGIDLGQPFQRGRRFQQNAALEQVPGRQHLHRRHRQRQRARAGNDEHRAGGQQCLPKRRAHHAPPPQEGGGGGEMHRGRITPRHPVRQHHEAAAPRLRRLDQPHAFRQQRRGPRGGGAQRDRLAQVQRPREHFRPRTRGHRQALAGDQAGVERGGAALDHPIHADALAGRHHDGGAGGDALLPLPVRAAVGLQHGDVGRAQRQQLFRGRARAAPVRVGPARGRSAERKAAWRRCRNRPARRRAWSRPGSWR